MNQCKRYCSLWMLTILLGFSGSMVAQSRAGFFANEDKKTTWLGIDFTELKLFGDSEANVQKIKDNYLGAINDLVLTEPDKYFVAKAFNRSNLVFDLSEVTRLNAEIDSNKLIVLKSDEVIHVTPARVQQIVSGYSLKEKTGYGIVFIMEGFNKSKTEATMFVTIIDMATQKVLLTQRMSGKAAGFGYRNYWARTVYEVLKTIDKSAYKDWQEGGK